MLSLKSKKRFTKEEDIKLLTLVSKYGPKNWKAISQEMNNRCGRQCRDRYVNYLSPDVKKTKWTIHEDRLLVDLYNQWGPKWSVIASKFKGRTASSVKNRWNFTIGRYITESHKKSRDSSKKKPMEQISKELELEFEEELDEPGEFNKEDSAKTIETVGTNKILLFDSNALDNLSQWDAFCNIFNE